MDNKLISLTGLVAVVSVVMIAWPTPSVAQDRRGRDHRACNTGHNTCVTRGASQGGVSVNGRATKVQVAPERRGGTVNDHRRK